MSSAVGKLKSPAIPFGRRGNSYDYKKCKTCPEVRFKERLFSSTFAAYFGSRNIHYLSLKVKENRKPLRCTPQGLKLAAYRIHNPGRRYLFIAGFWSDRQPDDRSASGGIDPLIGSLAI